MIKPIFENIPAFILGTGPSLASQSAAIKRRQIDGCKIFGINNTYKDFNLDVWIACDPQWHRHYGRTDIANCIQYHWDRQICQDYGYHFINGRQGQGLSTDPNFLHWGHSSGYQALNLAFLFGCDPIFLCGFDMSYPADGGPRHYFNGLSDKTGEYPSNLRKYSTFYGLLKNYESIAEQIYSDYPNCHDLKPGFPEIFNCTTTSALQCFPFSELQ